MQKKTTYNKLVRDKIPEVVQAKGQKAKIRVLSDEEYKLALLDKLVEEAMELRESLDDIEERADIAEVLRALDSALGFTAKEVEMTMETKKQRRGGFEKRLLLESVE